MTKTKWLYPGWGKALVKDGIGIVDGIDYDRIADPVIDEPINRHGSGICSPHYSFHPNESNWMEFRWDVCDKWLPVPDSPRGEGLEWNCQGVGVEWRNICKERIQND